jgi:hypothetical protein
VELVGKGRIGRGVDVRLDALTDLSGQLVRARERHLGVDARGVCVVVECGVQRGSRRDDNLV